MITYVVTPRGCFKEPYLAIGAPISLNLKPHRTLKLKEPYLSPFHRTYNYPKPYRSTYNPILATIPMNLQVLFSLLK